MSKKKKWIKPRHRLVRNIVFIFLSPALKLLMGLKVEKFKNPDKRQHLILMNHQTAYDQFFIGMAYKEPVYYIATEDIFSLGFLSKVLSFVIAPIPIKKQSTDLKAVKTCVKVAKEGGTIALFPEGNRTYSGKTLYFNPAIIKLIRVLKLPVLVFNAEGGYGVQPRWSDVLRHGKMRTFVSKVIEPEEYKDMTDDQLHKIITDSLYVDETKTGGLYYHKKSAEYMERVIYVCHECGLSEFESKNDIVKCKKCQKEVRYLPNKELEGVGFDFPFKYVSDWYDYQCDFINKLDTQKFTEEPLYTDTAKLSEVILYKKKVVLNESANIRLYGDRIETDEFTVMFENADLFTVLGRNKLNFYTDGRVYQLKGDKRFNAVKYMNMFYRYKNITMGDENEQFLGL